jgi:hypothetical protein
MCYVCLPYMLKFRALSEFSTPTLAAYGADRRGELSHSKACLGGSRHTLPFGGSRTDPLGNPRSTVFPMDSMHQGAIAKKRDGASFCQGQAQPKTPHTTVTTRDTERKRAGHKVYICKLTPCLPSPQTCSARISIAIRFFKLDYDAPILGSGA